MSAFLKAFHVLVVRPFWQEKIRTLLTVFGISLGVAILVAIDLTSNTAVAEFDNTVQQVAGRSNITIRGNAVPLRSTVISELEQYEEIELATPLIQDSITIEYDGKQRRVLLLGLDLLQADTSAEQVVRDYDVTLLDDFEFFDLFTNHSHVLMPLSLAANLGLGQGDGVTVKGDGAKLLPIGLISGNDIELIRGGDFIVADLAVADDLLNRNGTIDQIDVVTNPDMDEATALENLQEKLPSYMIIERPEQRGNNVGQMIAAFQFNLRALGHLSLLVGAFLIYNTMNISVLRRRPMIGTVRALGLRRSTIRFVFLGEGFLFGILGGLVGLVLGTVMSALLLDLVTDAISINFFQSEASRLILSPEQYISAFTLGLVFSVAAAINPASDAAVTPPANVMNSSDKRRSKRSEVLFTAAAIALLVIGFGILQLPVQTGIPWIGYTASALIILSMLLLSQQYLGRFMILVRGIYAKLFKADGLLAVAGIQGSLNKTSIAMAGLFLSVAMCVSVSVMIASFRSTVIVWMEQVLKADIYMIPENPEAGIPRSLEEELVSVEGIESIEPFQARIFEYNGRKANLAGGRFNQDRFAANMVDSSVTVDDLTQAVENDQVIITEAFARKNNLEKGDSISLPVREGSFYTTIAGIYYDYSSEQGYIVMDRLMFEKHYGANDFDSMAFFVKDGFDANQVREEILALSGVATGSTPVDLRLSGELRAFALTQFDRTFAITYALQLVAAGVAVLGIITTLLAQIIDRKKELRTLRTIGASAKRIGKLILLESSLISISGIIPGIIVGVVLSWILTTVIMLQSFGWTIQFQIPFFVLLQIGIVIFIATLIGSLIPVREASKI